MERTIDTLVIIFFFYKKYYEYYWKKKSAVIGEKDRKQVSNNIFRLHEKTSNMSSIFS